MTIKERKQELLNKYKEYIKWIDITRNRDFYTSGPNTGKGSKGTKYIYSYHTSVKRNGESIGYSIFADSMDNLENQIIKTIEYMEAK